MMRKLNQFVKQVENAENIILYNFYNGKSIKYSKVNFPTTESFIANDDIYELLKSEEFLLENFNFKNPYQELERTLQLILLVHEDCNFRCTYCYEKFEKRAMSLETANDIIKYINNEIKNNRSKYDKIQLSWFGGEPLLNLKTIEYISSSVIEIARKNKIEYSADMTTNGYLLNPRVFQKLVNLKVKSFQITVDGGQKYHDKQRILKNGHGTYERIISNLLLIQEMIPSDIFIVLRTNVGEENYKFMEEYIHESIINFGKCENILLAFHNIGNWGERNSKIIEKDVRFELASKVIEQGGHTVPFIWSMTASNLCYASIKNHYVIGSDGLVYKCTVALYQANNILGRIGRGGKLLISENKESLWVNSTETEECKSCSVLPICMNNRCPLKRLNADSLQYCISSKDKTSDMILMLEKQNLITYEIGIEV